MEILIIILLILLNGIFAMSEVALISARRSNLATRAKQGNKAARKALELAEDPDKFLSTIQIGITLIGILTGIYSGAALAGRFGEALASLGMPLKTATSVAQIVIVIVVTYLSIVFGELVPKRIGMKGAERVAILMARPMQVLSIVASPFVWLLSRSTEGITRLLGIKNVESKVTEAEIKSIIQEGTEDGEVQVVEQQIVGRVFSLGDRRVDSIMTHRSDIVWIDLDMTRDQINELVTREPHSLYPAARRSLDRTEGVIHLKDLFTHIEDKDFSPEQVVCQANFIHEKTEVYTALEQLREEQVGYGIVSDEFGVTQGIVTLRDIFEALVGTLPEKLDEPDIVRREDGSTLIDGQCPFYDFLVYFGLEDVYPHNRYNTLSGLILDELEHIPQTGEILQWHNFTMEIVDMDGARIDKVLVTVTHADDK
ncbi:hemolysin family protein [uncultured Alistipes sp.]|jgi:hemolysins and related proteins containing CBS domains|uniref:hemolysin family protein n=1 Tax=uncultured Alistipes sp. TaxID=538949 RepID=UPI0025CE2FF6|nr:hemolysin family protein [uncultured Alistipes sp.]